jgi:hypothetical protein
MFNNRAVTGMAIFAVIILNDGALFWHTQNLHQFLKSLNLALLLIQLMLVVISGLFLHFPDAHLLLQRSLNTPVLLLVVGYDLANYLHQPDNPLQLPQAICDIGLLQLLELRLVLLHPQ